MKKIGLVGFAYDTPSLNLQQENKDFYPEHFEWDHNNEGDQEIVVYCEQTMFEEKNDNAKVRIGLLIETRDLRPWHYASALEHRNEFNMILTHDRELLSIGRPFSFYPLGGSWIHEWDVFPKTKLISHIPGHKNFMTGHALRQLIADIYEPTGLIDVFRWGSIPDSKAPALRPYMFSIIVENCQRDYWFTEKLIDCFSQGTIPIYWGCPSIKKYFNDLGIVHFDTVQELEVIIKYMNKDDNGIKYYNQKINEVRTNLELAKNFASMENYLSKSYPMYFT